MEFDERFNRLELNSQASLHSLNLIYSSLTHIFHYSQRETSDKCVLALHQRRNNAVFTVGLGDFICFFIFQPKCKPILCMNDVLTLVLLHGIFITQTRVINNDELRYCSLYLLHLFIWVNACL